MNSTQKVKVLHLELDVHMGGIESFLYNLYSQIDREYVQFDFITRSDRPAMELELKKLGANIYQVSSYRKPLAYMHILTAVIENGYNVIHIHKNSAAIILPFIVAHRHKNLRIFVHSHNTRPSVGGLSKVLHTLNKGILWNFSNEHFACSEVAGEWLYGFNKKFTVLKNGIITKDYKYNPYLRDSKREELHIPSDGFVVGNIGRFTEQKNQKRLVEIFEQILKINKNSYLLLIGDGNQRKKVKDYCSKRHLTEHVFFLGVRNDIQGLLMAMDAFIMPSLYEGLPIVAIEAQSTGLPLYLSDTISKETEITDAVQWFSLEESDMNIAKKVKIDQCTEKDRLNRNSKVIEAGFDMQETANYLCEKYCEG